MLGDQTYQGCCSGSSNEARRGTGGRTFSLTIVLLGCYEVKHSWHSGDCCRFLGSLSPFVCPSCGPFMGLESWREAAGGPILGFRVFFLGFLRQPACLCNFERKACISCSLAFKRKSFHFRAGNLYFTLRCLQKLDDNRS